MSGSVGDAGGADDGGDGAAAGTSVGRKGFLVEPDVALPTLLPLCTLARHYRTAAYTLTATGSSVLSYLHHILAVEAEDSPERTVQRWSIVLWRTLLRYGAGVAELSTFCPARCSISMRPRAVIRLLGTSVPMSWA